MLTARLQESDEELLVIYETIRNGARDFLWAEYQVRAKPERTQACFVREAVGLAGKPFSRF